MFAPESYNNFFLRILIARQHKGAMFFVRQTMYNVLMYCYSTYIKCIFYFAKKLAKL